MSCAFPATAITKHFTKQRQICFYDTTDSNLHIFAKKPDQHSSSCLEATLERAASTRLATRYVELVLPFFDANV